MDKVILYEVDVIDCVFKRRLNRFVGEISINGKRTLAHITNTGRLTEYLVEDKKCKATRINGRRLKYRIVAVKDKDAYALIDTRLQSRAFEEAIGGSLLCFLKGCRVVAREPRVSEGRFDYLLDCPQGRVLVETKSAVLRGPRDEAMYPDCPTDRGVRHVRLLRELASRGARVAVIFTAAFPGARCFKPYKEGDPRLYQALSEALRDGVPVHAYSIYMTGSGQVALDNPCLPLCREWLEEARGV
ncbi:MAG: DNA/RNA nuclease SfsA [Desulfurococcales archaeon]|nr:DNA/RNA nuclease SfsA [Desulfurococcales archaeon]